MKAYFRVVRGLLRVPTYLLIVLYYLVGFLAAGYVPGRWGSFALGALIIAAWYINATSINDLKDFEIDQVNLSGNADRPLVTGAISKRGLTVIVAGSAGLTLLLAAGLGWPAVGLAIAAIAFNYTYSMPPFSVSRRGGLALALLPVGYVVFSMMLGVFAGGGVFAQVVWILLGINYLQFLARISLKDYRDVKGDAQFGKRTFLLRHGSAAVIRLALTCHIVAAAAALVWLYPVSPLLAAGFAFLAAMSGRFLIEIRRVHQWSGQRIWITAFGRLVSGQLTMILLAVFQQAGLLRSSYQLPALMVLVAAAFAWSAQQIIIRATQLADKKLA